MVLAGAVDLATQVAQLQATFAALQQKYPEFTELARRGKSCFLFFVGSLTAPYNHQASSLVQHP